MWVRNHKLKQNRIQLELSARDITSDNATIFNVQDLANTAWAFATAGFPNVGLFEVLNKADV